MPDPAAPLLDLAAIEARANAATPGPWWTGESGELYGKADYADLLEFSYDEDTCGDMSPSQAVFAQPVDAAFCAHARQDVPALVARVRALEAENDELRGWLRQARRAVKQWVAEYSRDPADNVLLAAIDHLATD